ncbi:uncharacterized protein LOC112089697 [Eutrema salsugineum]|uniref:uncharacterized protein LOC112089697 n=1 Tax=Eutrema salsugineum TaxID=72664 RepID=UPI000CECE425|nr:uncharacterized protein LOC112089697 [Eutrema salsugineum]
MAADSVPNAQITDASLTSVTQNLEKEIAKDNYEWLSPSKVSRRQQEVSPPQVEASSGSRFAELLNEEDETEEETKNEESAEVVETGEERDATDKHTEATIQSHTTSENDGEVMEGNQNSLQRAAKTAHRYVTKSSTASSVANGGGASRPRRKNNQKNNNQ